MIDGKKVYLSIVYLFCIHAPVVQAVQSAKHPSLQLYRTTVCLHDCDPETIRTAHKIEQCIYLIAEKLQATSSLKEPMIAWQDQNNCTGYTACALFDRGYMSIICINETNGVYLSIVHNKTVSSEITHLIHHFFNSTLYQSKVSAL